MNLIKYLKLDDLLTNLIGFIETKFELIKLDMYEGLRKVLARLVFFIVLLFAIFFSFFFAGLAFSIFINHKLNSSYLGFLVVAVINISLLLILYLMRNHRFFSIMAKKLLAQTFFEKDDQEEQQE